MLSDLPLVLLIDVAAEVADEVKRLNYRVIEGSLGNPYRTKVDGGVRPLAVSHDIPDGFQEADVVIIDLTVNAIDEKGRRPYGHPSTDVPWFRATEEIVDPRGFVGSLVQARFDEMFRRGAAFVVLAGPHKRQTLYIGTAEEANYEFSSMPSRTYHPYTFLSMLTRLNMGEESGSHVVLSEFGEELRTPNEGSRFDVAVLNVPVDSQALARNKDGHTVCFAGYDPRSADEDRRGFMLFCHQVTDSLAIPCWALEKVLPFFSQHLYPKKAAESWTIADPYGEPGVSDKLAEIVEVQRVAELKVSELQADIDAIREGATSRLALLTSTGDELVGAVKAAFEELGFDSVQDMDRQRADDERKKEDLRIVDADFVALCEVKGIVGMPKEEDLTAVVKYVSMAVRELDNPQVRGLTVVNHQRLVEPLKRTNSELYDPELERLLMDQYVGVMSTWDLFKLVRSFARCGWSHDEVREIFDAAGRLRPIPPRFSSVGILEHVWKQQCAFGIVLASGTLSIGDRYLVETNDGVWEGVVTSLQVNNRSVSTGNPGDDVGVVGTLSIDSVRSGSPLYVSRRQDA